MVKTKKQNTVLSESLNRVTRVHFLYFAAYCGAIVVFDSWNLIAHDSVIDFWTAAGAMLVLNTILWYLSRLNYPCTRLYQTAIILLVLADIVFAGLTVYWERGIASSSVILFAVPIITALALGRRSALIAAAILSTAAYSLAAVRYFYSHYGESYRVELYGEISFYCAVFFILAGLLISLSRSRS